MEQQPKIDIREALRYLGVSGEPSEELLREAREIAKGLERRVQPRYTYKVYELLRVSVDGKLSASVGVKDKAVEAEAETAGTGNEERRSEGGGTEFLLGNSGVRLIGKSTEKMLKDCEKAVLLSCTIGAEFESMLRREQAKDMARAVTLDVCGSAYVEAGCDQAERELKERLPGWYFTDRFSPGYGDLPLDTQKSIFAALEITKRLGVHLTETMLMNPSKSVTAVIGLSKRPQRARIRGCAYCSMRESCTLRKGGKRCGT